MGGRLSLGVALLAVTALILVGCGSTATTSPAEAKAVAAAEGGFLKEWGHAYKLGVARCDGLSVKAGRQCLLRVEDPLQRAAIVRFGKASETLLEGSLGPECDASLKDARSSMTSVPSFAGSTAFICREESRGAS